MNLIFSSVMYSLIVYRCRKLIMQLIQYTRKHYYYEVLTVQISLSCRTKFDYLMTMMNA